MLEADNGEIWRLRFDEELAHHAGCHVIVEGRVAATDELQVLWVGPQGMAAA